MLSFSRPFLVIILLSILAACGGGGGSKVQPVIVSTSSTSVASASAGEVISLTYDLTKLTFSWTTLKSSYLDLSTAAASAYSGSGTLAKESPTTARYVMTDTVTALVMGTLTPADNGTVIARLALPVLNASPVSVGGQTVASFGNPDPASPFHNKITVPVLGVKNPTSTATDVAGTYNFISISCSDKSNGFPFQTANSNGNAAGQLWSPSNLFNEGLCKTNYGTVKIVKGADEQTASIEYCNKNNLTASSCPSGTGQGTGTATYDLVKQVWLFAIDSLTETQQHAAVTFRSASNGQKVGWIDTNGGTLGYGQMVMAEQQTPTLSDLNGNYFGESASFNTTSHTVCGNGGTVTMDGVATFAMDSPWTGFASMDASPQINKSTGALATISDSLATVVHSTIALMAGAGVYVSRSAIEISGPDTGKPTPWGFEIGTRVGTATCP